MKKHGCRCSMDMGNYFLLLRSITVKEKKTNVFVRQWCMIVFLDIYCDIFKSLQQLLLWQSHIYVRSRTCAYVCTQCWIHILLYYTHGLLSKFLELFERDKFICIIYLLNILLSIKISSFSIVWNKTCLVYFYRLTFLLTVNVKFVPFPRIHEVRFLHDFCMLCTYTTCFINVYKAMTL